MKKKDDVEWYQENLVQFLKSKFYSTYKINGIKAKREEYANKSRISEGTLSRIKKGEGYDVPISTIYKICKFENVSIKDFFIEFEKFLEEKELESKPEKE